MTTLAVTVCVCAMPMIAVKPSGTIYCAACGMPVVKTIPPEDRP